MGRLTSAENRVGRAVGFVLALVLFTSHSPAEARGGTGTGIAMTKASVLEIEGGSTLHDWSSTATRMVLEAAFTSPVPASLGDAVRVGHALRLTLRVPVESMKSGKEKLDANMYKALDEKNHPEIVFTLARYAPADSANVADTLAFVAFGTLTVAGEERPIEMKVRVNPAKQGLRVRGMTELKMTDFGIKPPTMFLGTLRTKDDVAIRFDIGLEPRTTAARDNS